MEGEPNKQPTQEKEGRSGLENRQEGIRAAQENVKMAFDLRLPEVPEMIEKDPYFRKS